MIDGSRPTNPSCDKTLFEVVNYIRFTVNVVKEKDGSTVNGVFYLHTKSLEKTSSGAYTAVFPSPSAYGAQNDRFDIFQHRHTIKNIHTGLESLSEMSNTVQNLVI